MVPEEEAPLTPSSSAVFVAAMILKTQTPLLKSGLGDQKKLHCQFAVDHRGPSFTVEWHRQGERATLFSHASRSGQTEGGGVDRKGLTGGDASYNLAFTKVSSGGTYVCSVSVAPLDARVDINLDIEGAEVMNPGSRGHGGVVCQSSLLTLIINVSSVSPRVSLSVGPTLTLQEGQVHKVVCEVERYYPLDVKMVWFKQEAGQPAGSLLPTIIPNTLLSSHRHNSDRTLSLSSFFYITASLSDSGKQFTCKVSHQSLRVDIKKSFVLTVEGE